jgi:hypothetical protein
VIRNRKIFRDCATGGRIEVFDFGDASTSTRVRRDDAGVDRDGIASYDPFLHTARHHGLDSLHRRSLSRKRPRRFFENVE